MDREQETYLLSNNISTHANTLVVGENIWITDRIGNTVPVNVFTYEMDNPISIPAVHAAVIYDYYITEICYVLVICK